MIKADIVDRVCQTAEIPRVKAVVAVETVIEAMRNALGGGDRIELRGFGVFQVKRRKRGIGRNPKTGVEVNIPPGNTIRFKPGKDLRDLR
jgi:DNA-binding protein HU-beta